jgi:hypothetical protein
LAKKPTILNSKGPKRIIGWTSGAIGSLMLACEPGLWLAGTFARAYAENLVTAPAAE